MLRLPPLNALRAFEAAARHVSFKRAAEELCVSQGAISRHIARLEHHLAIRLFHRRHRKVSLTWDGEAYLGAVRDAFGQISHATAALASRADGRMLRLKLPPTLATRWLVPRLGRFHAQHSEVSVQIATSHDPADFAQEDVDVAINYGGPLDGACVSERLFDEVLVPICSPSLAAGPPPLASTRDLKRHLLLHSLQRREDWRKWLAAAAIGDIDPRGGLIFENSILTCQGAIDGLGVAIAQLTLVADDLAARRLVVPFDVQLRSDRGYFLAFPPHKARLKVVQAFRAWITEEASATRRALGQPS